MALAVASAGAQVEARPPCDPAGNPDLGRVSELESGQILDTSVQVDYWIRDGHATSLLPAEGVPPSEPDSKEPDVAEEYANAYSDWTCMYGPERAVDGDPTTAWSEGAPGTGIGEVLLVFLGDARKAEIWTGFGLSDRLHARNGRPREVRVHVLQPLTAMPNQYDITYGHFLKLAETRATLADLNGWQPLPIPSFETITSTKRIRSELSPYFSEVPDYVIVPEEWRQAVFIAIEIVDVYPGSVYEDTLISEVRGVE
jgi:hypothetical protein